MTPQTDLRTRLANYVEGPPALAFDSGDLVSQGRSGVRRRRALVASMAAAAVVVSLSSALALRANDDPDSSGPATERKDATTAFTTPSEEMPDMLDAVAQDYLPGYERTELRGVTWAHSDVYYNGYTFPPEDVVDESRYDEATDWQVRYTKDGTEVSWSVSYGAPDINPLDPSQCPGPPEEPCSVDRLPGGITVLTQKPTQQTGNSVWVRFDNQPRFVIVVTSESLTFDQETMRRIALDERLRFRIPEKLPGLPSYWECISAASEDRDVPGCPENPNGKQR